MYVDFLTGLDGAIEMYCHPFPTTEEAFNKLNGGTLFVQSDFDDAYLQV